MSVKLSESSVVDFLMLRREGTVSDISEHLNMSPSTVSGILTRLDKKGLVAKGPLRPGARGRPRVTYQLLLPKRMISLHINATELSGAVVEKDLTVGAVERRQYTSIDSLDQGLGAAREVVRALLTRSGLATNDILGVAMCMNAITLGDRTVVSSVLPWASDDVEQVFSQSLSVPVKVVSRPRTLADYQGLSEPLPGSCVSFQVADGVSAHQIVFGQVYRGGSSMAGELGHVTVDASGPICGCGRRGCLEAYCSGPAIYRRILTDLQSSVVSTLNADELKKLTPREAIVKVWEAWQAGDSYVRALIDEVLNRLAWGLGLVVNLFDPEVITAGGYVLEGKLQWVEDIYRRSQRWTLHPAKRDIRIEMARSSVTEELRAIACEFCYPSGWSNS